MRLLAGMSVLAIGIVLAIGAGSVAAQTDSVSTTVNPMIPRMSDIPGEADPAMVANLRKGGYVIYFRHASTDWGQKDTAGEDFENRAAQRNLSEVGKAEAASIGSAFKTLGIPIDTVYANPMLRCRDTAQIAFGKNRVLVELFRKGPEYRQRRIEILSTPPNAGFNRVVVGQQDPLIPLIPGLHRDELREAEALVIQPLGAGQYKVVAQVTLADWARLAAAYPAKAKTSK